MIRGLHTTGCAKDRCGRYAIVEEGIRSIDLSRRICDRVKDRIIDQDKRVSSGLITCWIPWDLEWKRRMDSQHNSGGSSKEQDRRCRIAYQLQLSTGWTSPSYGHTAVSPSDWLLAECGIVTSAQGLLLLFLGLRLSCITYCGVLLATPAIHPWLCVLMAVGAVPTTVRQSGSTLLSVIANT